MEKDVKPRLFELCSVYYAYRMSKKDLTEDDKKWVDYYSNKLNFREKTELAIFAGLYIGRSTCEFIGLLS